MPINLDNVKPSFDDTVNSFMLQFGVPILKIGITKATNNSIFEYSTVGSEQSVGKSHFLLSSIAKTLTAFSVINSHRELGFELGDSLIQHLPELTDRSNVDARVRIYDLLGHTAGINPTTFNWAKITNEESSLSISESLLKSSYSVTVNADNLGRWTYSNTGYDLLGALLERKSGLAFSDFIRSTLLSPLGMENTILDIVPASTLYPPTIYAKGETLSVGLIPYAVRHQPSAVIYSTIQDLAKWGEFLAIKGRGFSNFSSHLNSTFDSMWRPRVETGIQYCSWYGLGWYAANWAGCNVVGHGGKECGFNSLLLIFPDDEVSVSILMNTHTAETVLLAARLIKFLIKARIVSPTGYNNL